MREPAARIFSAELGFLKSLEISKVFLTGVVIEMRRRSGESQLELQDELGVVRCVARDGETLLRDLQIGELIGIIGNVEKEEDEIVVRIEELFRIGEDERKIWLIEALCSAMERFKKIGEKEERLEWLKREVEAVALSLSEELLADSVKRFSEKGCSYEELLEKLRVPEEFLQEALRELLLSGVIYEPRPGFYRRVA